MLSKELIKPENIVVIGGSNNLSKPGGKILQNLLNGNFNGELYVVNPKEDVVQGVKCYHDVSLLPGTDLAILAIPARFCGDAVELLIRDKGTRGFIILSAGFGEESEEGSAMEKHISSLIDGVGGTLIGPNCIGVISRHYQGVFTSPIPKLDPAGCDFISGSGATAVFIMEAGIPKGLTFSSVYSVGNSAQTGVEDVLKHLDETFDEQTSSRVILLYLENIENPDVLLEHAGSLIQKGCRIAAIKSGTTEAGSRAASSHTGALASPDVAVDALLRKAGILRCHSREELIAIASVFRHSPLKGRRVAVITHAGGPAVMLTDVLSEEGLEVPPIDNPKAEELLAQLAPGSSVSNPIDILATGSAEQLGLVIDYCEHEFDEIDGMIVIFGTPGLFKVNDVYRVLDEKMKTCKKPIFPVLPSVVNAAEEIKEFLSYGRINFPDEVVLGRALAKVFKHRASPRPVTDTKDSHSTDKKLDEGSGKDPKLVDEQKIREIMDGIPAGDVYLSPDNVQSLLDAAGIPRVPEEIVTTKVEAVLKAEELGLPVVMKVVGPVHKSDVGGIVLNVGSANRVSEEFEKLMQIEGTEAVLIQPMLSGMELFAGAKREEKFGHIVMCGLGGIFVEALKDVSSGLVPLGIEEAMDMISGLQGYPVIRGIRGEEGVDEAVFAEILERLSQLVKSAPEIAEMDLNPLLAEKERVVAVDARIRISK